MVILQKRGLRVGSDTQVQVCARVLKNLYGLKQVCLNWFETLDNYLLSIGLQKLKSEPIIYILRGMDNQTARKPVVA